MLRLSGSSRHLSHFIEVTTPLRRFYQSRTSEVFRKIPLSSDYPSSSTSQDQWKRKTWSGGSYFFLSALTSTIGSITAFGIIHLLTLDEKERQTKLINLGLQANMSLCRSCISRSALYEELFMAVYEKNYPRAKKLIRLGEIDVNVINKLSERQSEALLDHLPSPRESDVVQWIKFAEFILKRGYRHLNRPVGGQELAGNLLAHIYQTTSFNNDVDLRHKIVVFLLVKGVNPVDSVNFKSPLYLACENGDGKFFIEKCKDLSVPLDEERVRDCVAHHAIQLDESQT